ncbi:MAG: prolyl oligopeptidase family serine peptidase [Bacteroidota bacterium]
MLKSRGYDGRLFLAMLFWSSCAMAVVAQSLTLPPDLRQEIPFDFDELSKAPTHDWLSQEDSVWSLLYEGESFNGKPTQVFAYYASPATLTGQPTQNQFPGVVLLHGGGGTAFAVWVREWAQRGYAAIAMDLGGAQPLPESEQNYPWGTQSTPLPDGGPDDTDVYKFYSLEEDVSQQWQFHAIANAIRAHSLLRSFTETDSSRTAITGISWGGYLTNIVASIDRRFKAAVPVYGCGFLGEKSTWMNQFDSLGMDQAGKWLRMWDPSSYVPYGQVPMLYVNGTNDFAYHVESWQQTIDLASKASQTLIHEMKHNHEKGAEPPEIANFIDRMLERDIQLLTITAPEKVGSWYRCEVPEPHADALEVTFIFTTESKPNQERQWQQSEAQWKDGAAFLQSKQDIKACYFQFTDTDGIRWSSPVSFY